MSTGRRDRHALVLPLAGALYGSPEHLGIASVAAAMARDGLQPRLFVLDQHDQRAATELAELLAWQPGFVGLTTQTDNLEMIGDLTGLLRKHLPDAHLCCGGDTASYCAEELLRHLPDLDSVVIGEGERTCCELVQRLQDGAGLAGCAGTAFRDRDGGFVVNPVRPPIADLDTLAFPDRSVFARFRPRFLRVSTSRGCLARCTFCSRCPSSLQGAPRWRGRSIDSVLAELHGLVERFGVRSIEFIDLSFEDCLPEGKERLGQLAEALLQSGPEIRFQAFFRTDTLGPDDRELLALLTRAGLRRAAIGLEAGTSKGLRSLGKRAGLADNQRTLDLLRAARVAVAHGFIMFEPYSSFESLRRNAEALVRWGTAALLHFFTTVLEVYPGTAIRHRLQRDGLLEPSEGISNRLPYRFQDARIGRLARTMERLRAEHELVMETEMLMTYTDTARAMIELGEQADRAFEELQALATALATARDELTAVNVELFSRCLELAHNGWQEERCRQWWQELALPVHERCNAALRQARNRFFVHLGRKGLRPRVW